MYDSRPGIAIITRKTRLQGLLARWSTKGQAKFRLKAAALQEKARAGHAITDDTLAESDEAFSAVEDEDSVYQRAVGQLHKALNFGLPVQVVDREFVPNFDFARFEVVVVIGQDGLVANAAKYVGDVPIVAVNPDPRTIDGVLLPFKLADVRRAVGRVLENNYSTRDVTLAEATLPDGQKLLAFNDLFVGAKSHVSARYRLTTSDGRSEVQSSSGIIITTGAGSTGWMSSVFNMAAGVAGFLGGSPMSPPPIPWEARNLLWGVREPFRSKSTQTGLVMGWVEEGSELVIESLMPAGGVIFSDGVEADFLEFNSGAIARVGASQQRARLVWK